MMNRPSTVHIRELLQRIHPNLSSSSSSKLLPSQEISAVIQHLKEQHELPELYSRKFDPSRPSIPSSSPPTSTSVSSNTFRVMQFNLLAEGLSSPPEEELTSPIPFPELKQKNGDYGGFDLDDDRYRIFDFKIRQWRLVEEISRYLPDVLAVEEIDHFDDFFFPILQHLGYSGKFQPKASSPCLAYGYYSDGVAIFWRNEVFSDDTNSPLPHPLTPSAYPTTFVSTILTHRLTNQPIFFLATHLKAKSSMECEEIRASQVRYLLAHMDQILTEKQLERCILLGDFNADPYPVPQKKTKGESQEGEEKMVNIPPLAVQSVRDWHDSFLESVYPLPQDGQSSLSLSSSSTEESSPPLLPMTYTTCKYRQGKESKHVIDYIFYSHRSLLVTSRLGTLDPQEIEQEGKPLALPNLKYPSDHISLVADMEIL